VYFLPPTQAAAARGETAEEALASQSSLLAATTATAAEEEQAAARGEMAEEATASQSSLLAATTATATATEQAAEGAKKPPVCWLNKFRTTLVLRKCFDGVFTCLSLLDLLQNQTLCKWMREEKTPILRAGRVVPRAGDEEARYKRASEALLAAAEAKDVQAVASIVTQFVGILGVVRAQDDYGKSPLWYATENMACLGLLIATGADVQAQDQHGRSPSYRAASLGLVNSLKLLAACGADQNATNKSGGTVLCAAIDGGHIECVKVLILSGRANINKESLVGLVPHSPLQCALLKKDVACVQFLLQQGAVDKNGEAAAWLSDNALVHAILNFDIARAESELLLASSSSSPSSSSSSSLANRRERDWKAPNLLSAIGGALQTQAGIVTAGGAEIPPELLRFLHGSSSTRNGNDCCGGLTPLEAALKTKQRDMVQLLLEHGAEDVGGAAQAWMRGEGGEGRAGAEAEE